MSPRLGPDPRRFPAHPQEALSFPTSGAQVPSRKCSTWIAPRTRTTRAGWRSRLTLFASTLAVSSALPTTAVATPAPTTTTTTTTAAAPTPAPTTTTIATPTPTPAPTTTTTTTAVVVPAPASATTTTQQVPPLAAATPPPMAKRHRHKKPGRRARAPPLRRRRAPPGRRHRSADEACFVEQRCAGTGGGERARCGRHRERRPRGESSVDSVRSRR